MERPMEEPTDTNWKYEIAADQEGIDYLFEDDEVHFTERCLQYQAINMDTEWRLVLKHKQ